MTPRDHNKTVAILYAIPAWYFSFLVLLAPTVVYFNLSPPGSRSRGDQIFYTAVGCTIFFALAVPLHVASVGIRRRRRWARRLAFALMPLLIFCLPPAVPYAWWFFHSEAGKQIYGEPGGEE